MKNITANTQSTNLICTSLRKEVFPEFHEEIELFEFSKCACSFFLSQHKLKILN